MMYCLYRMKKSTLIVGGLCAMAVITVITVQIKKKVSTTQAGMYHQEKPDTTYVVEEKKKIPGSSMEILLLKKENLDDWSIIDQHIAISPKERFEVGDRVKILKTTIYTSEPTRSLKITEVIR